MTTVRWGAYDLPTVLLSTELNGLASGGLSAPSTEMINSQGALYCDFEFVPGAALSPTTNAQLDLWLLRSIDGGLSFEDGSASAMPPRDPDLTIPVRSGTLILPRAGLGQLVLPPGHYKGMLRNRLGVSIPSGSSVRFASYTELAV